MKIKDIAYFNKEMKYTNTLNKAELLARGIFKGYEYIVVSVGTHPCAYIVLTDNDEMFGMDYNRIQDKYDIDCHGGLTYSEPSLCFLTEINGRMVKGCIEDKWVIGWDYGHYGDYLGYDGLMGTGKRWSTSEIVEECKECINQLEVLYNGF